ncbi:hypothetical protein [Saccharopolyspora taberi]|uniref:Cytosine deaminase n=1 Tax=Saccharopolyspora taberi TaxID=60895 RepID=A0ABN3VBF1_9PSEU
MLRARAVLGLSLAELRPGGPAELLAVRAGDLGAAVAHATEDRVVFHKGRLVARTAVTSELRRR